MLIQTRNTQSFKAPGCTSKPSSGSKVLLQPSEERKFWQQKPQSVPFEADSKALETGKKNGNKSMSCHFKLREINSNSTHLNCFLCFARRSQLAVVVFNSSVLLSTELSAKIESSLPQSNKSHESKSVNEEVFRGPGSLRGLAHENRFLFRFARCPGEELPALSPSSASLVGALGVLRHHALALLLFAFARRNALAHLLWFLAFL